MSIPLLIIKSPILWIAAIASSLMLATFPDFGFVWYLTLQIDLGWNRTHAVVFSFLFLAGLITGGYFATLISKRFGTCKTVLTNITYSVALFAMALFVTPWQHQMWFVCPVLFTIGAGFGTCAMIVPYFTQFCRSESSGMYFAFTEVINASLIGTLVAIPLWVESATFNATDWAIKRLPRFTPDHTGSSRRCRKSSRRFAYHFIPPTIPLLPPPKPHKTRLNRRADWFWFRSWITTHRHSVIRKVNTTER